MCVCDIMILCMDIKGNSQLLTYSTVCYLVIPILNKYQRSSYNPINWGCAGNVIALLIILT